MKRALIVLAGIAMFAATSYAETFHGNIMDSACAKTGAHKMGMGKAKECTEGCVKGGATYVLYNPSTKMTYMLDDQTKPADLAGEAVTVTGTYDKASKTIHVADIKRGS